MTEIQLPDPGLFGRRRTRRAVVRGLLRTAFLALMGFFVISLLVQMLGNALMNRLDRADALERVGFTGYQVGHPGLELHERSLVVGWRHAKGNLAAATQDGLRIDVPISMSIFGTLSRPPTQLDPLDRTLLGPGSTPPEALAFLHQLPSGVRVDAVVQLARPTHPVDLPSIGDVPGRFVTLFYSPVFGTTKDHIARPVTWSDRYGSLLHAERSFREWAESLRSSDDDNLRWLHLPTSEELKETARADLVYALYVRDQTPAALKALLGDSRVRSFTPTAVRFALPAQVNVQ